MSKMRRIKDTAIWLAELAAFALLIIIIGEFLLSRSFYKEARFNGGYLAELREISESDRLLIFAPHEDDELLGAGVLIQKALDSGAEVTVCLVTNGEYPEASVILQERTIALKPEAFVNLGYMRQKETLQALEILGLDEGNVIFLGYPDHAINKLLSPYHWAIDDAVMSPRTKSTYSPYSNSFTPSAPHSGTSLLRDLVTIISYVKPTIVVTTHPYDVHIDHWSVYAFVKMALNSIEEEWARPGEIDLLSYLIHRPDWPVVKSRRPSFSLIPPKGFAGLESMEWFALPASVSDTLMKNKAMLSYKSQLASLSPLLRSFVRANELFSSQLDLSWNIEKDENSLPVQIEPVSDNILVQRNPICDISGMRALFMGRAVTVEVSFAKPVTRAVNIEIGFSFGHSSKGVVVGSLRLVSGSLSGAYSKEGNTYFPDEEISGKLNGRTAKFSFPMPAEFEPEWMQVWSRSSIGLKSIDQSMIYFIRL